MQSLQRICPDRHTATTPRVSTPFDVAVFLAKAGPERKVVQLKPKQVFFSQGEPANAVFLGYHLKTGHTLSVQNRPTGLAEDVIVLPCFSV
jgi:hypothetical protein